MIIGLSVLGVIYWKWYAPKIVIGVGLVLGSIYSLIVSWWVNRQTGLDIEGQEIAEKARQIMEGG